ncbi:hypothetical protein LZ31DRAFT_192470 [Colletotrichum somersetense]|nr:hypothetical protein LZ31DRAFT_192470 [Colletotrichum somersetense]
MSQLHVHATQGHERSWLPPALSPLMKIPGSAGTSLDPREDRKCPRNPGFFGQAPDDPSGLRRDGPRAGLTSDTHRVDCTIVTARRPFPLYSVASYRPNTSLVMTLDACWGAKSRLSASPRAMLVKGRRGRAWQIPRQSRQASCWFCGVQPYSRYTPLGKGGKEKGKHYSRARRAISLGALHLLESTWERKL